MKIKRILATAMAVIMVFAIFSLTGCSNKEDLSEISTTSQLFKDENLTAPSKRVVSAETKQNLYEALFKNPSKMELNSKNVKMIMTNDDIKNEVLYDESGNGMMSAYSSGTLVYIIYVIGDYTYVEMYFPEYKDENGKTIKAENVYYKAKGDSKLLNEFNAYEEIVVSLNRAKEYIKSVKYSETKDIEGVSCDVVEISNGESTIFFYFTAHEMKLFRAVSDNWGTVIDRYFPTDLAIELPKDIKFTEVDEETMSQKFTSLNLIVSSSSYDN